MDENCIVLLVGVMQNLRSVSQARHLRYRREAFEEKQERVSLLFLMRIIYLRSPVPSIFTDVEHAGMCREYNLWTFGEIHYTSIKE